jgi:hypothetical protein
MADPGPFSEALAKATAMPVVLMHGGMMAAQNFISTAEALARGKPRRIDDPVDDDWSFLWRALGWLPTGLGSVLILLGAFYYSQEWRYAGAILIWSLMWGLMLVGLGLPIMATGRRWMAIAGIVLSSASALLAFRWDRYTSIDDWLLWLYPGDALGVLLAVIALWRARRRALRASRIRQA